MKVQGLLHALTLQWCQTTAQDGDILNLCINPSVMSNYCPGLRYFKFIGLINALSIAACEGLKVLTVHHGMHWGLNKGTGFVCFNLCGFVVGHQMVKCSELNCSRYFSHKISS